MDSLQLITDDDSRVPRPSGFKRTYKACEACRRTKAKCVRDELSQVCFKCKREQRECVFPAARSTKRAKLSHVSARYCPPAYAELIVDSHRELTTASGPNNTDNRGLQSTQPHHRAWWPLWGHGRALCVQVNRNRGLVPRIKWTRNLQGPLIQKGVRHGEIRAMTRIPRL